MLPGILPHKTKVLILQLDFYSGKGLVTTKIGGREPVVDFNLILFLILSNHYNFCSQIKILLSKTILNPSKAKVSWELKVSYSFTVTC